MKEVLDSFDSKALACLLDRGRMTWAELGEALGLSPPAAAERVRKLEARGLILGYTAVIDPLALGYSITAFIEVTLERPDYRPAFLKLVQQLPDVQECHHMAGDHDYLLKVRCRDVRSLELLISERLKSQRGIVRTRTNVVLSTCKETAAVAVAPAR
jgi:Lrp/AsnC family leucine-responsive transcriptional regulator